MTNHTIYTIEDYQWKYTGFTKDNDVIYEKGEHTIVVNDKRVILDDTLELSLGELKSIVDEILLYEKF